MNKQSVVLPGADGAWGSYISKYQPDSSKVLDNMFTAESKNFVTDQTGMIQKRQGGIQWNRTSFPEAAKDTYEAVFESGARHFLRVGGGVLSASTGTGLFDVITSGYSAIGNFEWATYQNRSYGCNGINAPQVYDIATSYGGVNYSFTTAKTKVMGAQAPVTGPTAAAPSAGGAVPIGPHRYKVTFVYYESEESNGSTASAVQTTTAGVQTIALSALPIGGYGVTARNIYRDNNDGVYLLLDTVANNTATTYTDVLLIGSTPTPMPLFNDAPPTFSKIALWLDSLFIAPTGETSLIRYSNSGAPDVFDPGNFVACQSDDVVTALYVYNGKLYVFGLHSFGSIEGNTPDTFYYRNISNLIGCVDNRSIQIRSIVSVPTLWWLSDKGFYYSNGTTVEYGSDFIQDLVNLNVAQVNYTTNRNTQTSFADFSGDTITGGIDISSNPGAVTTFNPVQEYNTTAAWVGGSSVTNIKTNNGNFAEVPTQFAPSLSSGVLGGDASINGTNLNIPSSSDFTGATNTFRADFTHWGNSANDGGLGGVATPFNVPRDGVLNSFTTTWNSGSGSIQVGMKIMNDSGGVPGSTVLATSPTTYTGTSLSGSPFTFSVPLAAGSYFAVIYVLNRSLANVITDTRRSDPNTYITGGIYRSVLTFSEGFSWGYWGEYSYSSFSFTSDPIVKAGTWFSPVYDAGGTTAVGDTLTQSGTYPSGTSGTLTLYASPNANMSGSVTQVVTAPNGVTAVILAGYRYWQMGVNIATVDNRSVPVMGTPLLTFSTSATWISQPIDTTTDNTGWGTLTYTGNVPFGTSIVLTIATCATQFGVYSAYTDISLAIVEQWAKVKFVLTTDASNTVSPSISSVTLTWGLTSTITSSIIDTGTDPAGFGTIQWEQIDLNVGTVQFFIRTAATAGGIPAASWVAVNNGEFPNLSALRYVQWKAVLTSTPNNAPSITSITVNWLKSAGTVGVRCASVFYNKTYYVSVAMIGATENDTIIQLDQFGNWRIQKDASIGTFLTYFNTLYFTDGISDLIFNGFIANTDNGAAIAMDARTKAWNAENDLFLKVPRAFKITGLNTGTILHVYYSSNRGATWVEMLNEMGVAGYTTNDSGTEFTVLFVPDATTLVSGRTLMYRIVSNDTYPCSIVNYVPSFYARRGRYLNNG